jgi:hypothetical protein
MQNRLRQHTQSASRATHRVIPLRRMPAGFSRHLTTRARYGPMRTRLSSARCCRRSYGPLPVPPTAGNQWRCASCRESTDWVLALEQRHRHVALSCEPSGSWWLRERILDRAEVRLRSELLSAAATNLFLAFRRSAERFVAADPVETRC